jgi:hypothetical protein
MRTNLRSVIGGLALATMMLGGLATPTTAVAAPGCGSSTNPVGNPLGGTGDGGSQRHGLNAVGNPLGGTGDGGTRNAYGDGLNSVGNPLGGTGDGGTLNARCG